MPRFQPPISGVATMGLLDHLKKKLAKIMPKTKNEALVVVSGLGYFSLAMASDCLISGRFGDSSFQRFIGRRVLDVFVMGSMATSGLMGWTYSRNYHKVIQQEQINQEIGKKIPALMAVISGLDQQGLHKDEIKKITELYFAPELNKVLSDHEHKINLKKNYESDYNIEIFDRLVAGICDETLKISSAKKVPN